MRLKLLVCFLVCYAYANHNAAWQHNQQYTYQVRGRLLTSLNQINSNYTGILLKSKLIIQPTSDGNLKAQISNPQYADIHSSLDEDWRQDIPDSELHYKELPLSSKPFKVIMDNGVVTDVIVDNTIKNWEANMIKGVVSQLQLDTDAENQIRSSINIFSQDKTNTAVFKTMEKTVTGETETLYEIHPFPEYILQSTPWLAPSWQPNSQENLIEVLKNKNFTNSLENPSYAFGQDGISGFEVENQIAEFFGRTSVSRYILTGDLKSFTIQSAVTVDKYTVAPTLQDQERGATGSIVNITLQSVTPNNQELGDVSNPTSVGIVYRYNQPFDESNEPQLKLSPQPRGKRNAYSLASGESGDPQSSEEYPHVQEKTHIYQAPASPLLPFVAGYKRDAYSLASGESGDPQSSEEYPHVQEKPHIHQAPASPLLPFVVGYDGQSISKKQNIKEKVRTLAKSIGQELQSPENIPEKNTVGKFLILTSLVKVMNHKEMQEVSAQLYTHEEHGAAVAAWVAYRDAIAQAGTGPALLLIEEWILSNKISGNQAAQVVASAAQSTRQPTEKYMKVLFGMISNQQIMQQDELNTTLLLSFTELVHQVYVNKQVSHDKFPVHSFGSFNNEQGRLFVEKEVIPHLASRLNEAINKGDTEQIHVYIRALGNVGHKRILQVLKPYLEGTKKASQFQRVLMVLALDNLVKNDPKVARSVLFKLYRNPRDAEQIRVAAVYQLMRANPSPAMLQRMAMYTKIDTNNHVNSAVKSAIESAAEVDVPHLDHLRMAAQSAQPLLTSQEFGVQHSKTFLQNYVVEQMQLEIKQLVDVFGGEDSAWPKGLNYLLRGRFGGVKQSVAKVQAMASSIEDLVTVSKEQTKRYRQLVKEKQSFGSVKTKWSSENTAKLLNLQNEQREQLEGYILLHLQSLQKVYSFDNNTIENLTEVVREWEEELRQGKHLHYQKLTVHPESAMSFPTAWGLPFIYTYDRPTLVNIESDLKVNAQPPVYSEDGLQTPDSVDVEYSVKAFVSARAQGQFGIFTHFNHRRYSAGYDKNFQLILPRVSGKIHIDVEHQQVTLDAAISDTSNYFNVLHFSSWPYTTQYEIDNVKPPTEIIHKQNRQIINTVLGQKATGVALKLQVASDRKIDFGLLFEKLENEDLMSPLLGSWLDDSIQQVEINIGIDSSKSTSNKLTVHLGHQQDYSPGLKSRNRVLDKLSHKEPISEESWERQNEFLKNSSQGINNVHSMVVDTIVLFEGKKPIKYSATLGGARSNSDPKGRILLQAQQNNEIQYSKVQLKADVNSPNPPSLNVKAAFNFDPTQTIKIKTNIVGNKRKAPTEISANIKLYQSEERKQYLMQHQQYKRCQQEMQQGNNQLSACATITAEANLLDQFKVKVDYQNVDPPLINRTYHLYSILRYFLHPRISENILSGGQSQQNSLTIEGQYSPDLSAVNASISSEHGDAEISNVPLDDFARSLLVSHPLYNVKERLQAYALNYPTLEPICVADRQAIVTLDNKTYPVNLDKNWVVFHHFVPRRPSPSESAQDSPVTEQLNNQVEGYIVYIRASEKDSSQKEVKMVIQSPYTLGKVIDITLKPSADSSGYPRLFVQNEQIMYNDQGSHIYDDYMQVYKLPNQELKTVVYGSFSAVYDGTRIKLAVTADKARDASRGLCGTFTGEEETDFTHPGNCIIHNPEAFVATNTVPEQPHMKRLNDMLMIQAGEKKCYQKAVGYVQVVSAKDSGITAGLYGRPSSIVHRTKYLVNGNEICFSLRPLPVCAEGRGLHVEKPVEVHCLQQSKMTTMMMRQINSGANPDFWHKSADKTLLMEVAERC